MYGEEERKIIEHVLTTNRVFLRIYFEDLLDKIRRFK